MFCFQSNWLVFSVIRWGLSTGFPDNLIRQVTLLSSGHFLDHGFLTSKRALDVPSGSPGCWPRTVGDASGCGQPQWLALCVIPVSAFSRWKAAGSSVYFMFMGGKCGKDKSRAFLGHGINLNEVIKVRI